MTTNTMLSQGNFGSPARSVGSGSASLVPIDIACEKGLALARTVTESENVTLNQAAGRVAAKAVIATMPSPPFDNSAMDGYALRTTDLTGEPPYELPVESRVAAGDSGTLNKDCGARFAVRILTGAPIPVGFDAVAMQEHCAPDNGRITLQTAPQPGLNIRRSGEDCASGTEAVSAGTLLDSRHIALLAALGLSTVSVRRRVKVARFSTGSELRQPGEDLAAGQIYNSNRYMLHAMLESPHVEQLDLGTIPDDPEKLGRALLDAADCGDVVFSTGGVSVGDEDHMPRLVKQAGGSLHVMKVAIKPGKPLTLGTLGKAIYIGLPGNPVAAFVNCMLIGKPVIGKLAGIAPVQPPSRKVTAGFERSRRPGRQEYLPARVTHTDEDGRATVDIFRNAGSASLFPLAQADGFVVLRTEQARITHGDELTFMPFR